MFINRPLVRSARSLGLDLAAWPDGRPIHEESQNINNITSQHCLYAFFLVSIRRSCFLCAQLPKRGELHHELLHSGSKLPRRRPSRRPLKTFNRSQLPSEDKSPCADWVLFGQLGKVLRVDADHVKAAENTLGDILLQIKAGGEVNIACLDEGEWEVLRHSPRRRYKVVSKGKR